MRKKGRRTGEIGKKVRDQYAETPDGAQAPVSPFEFFFQALKIQI
jgi:hypothetical protein